MAVSRVLVEAAFLLAGCLLFDFLDVAETIPDQVGPKAKAGKCLAALPSPQSINGYAPSFREILPTEKSLIGTNNFKCVFCHTEEHIARRGMPGKFPSPALRPVQRGSLPPLLEPSA